MAKIVELENVEKKGGRKEGKGMERGGNTGKRVRGWAKEGMQGKGFPCGGTFRKAGERSYNVQGPH